MRSWEDYNGQQPALLSSDPFSNRGGNGSRQCRHLGDHDHWYGTWPHSLKLFYHNHTAKNRFAFQGEVPIGGGEVQMGYGLHILCTMPSGLVFIYFALFKWVVNNAFWACLYLFCAVQMGCKQCLLGLSSCLAFLRFRLVREEFTRAPCDWRAEWRHEEARKNKFKFVASLKWIVSMAYKELCFDFGVKCDFDFGWAPKHCLGLVKSNNF